MLAVIAAVVLAIAGDAASARRKVPPPEPAVASLPQNLFGAGEIAHPPATDFAKWTDTIARYERERAQERTLCENGDCAPVRWREFLETVRGLDALAQLRAVNAYLNRVPYRTDLENYGSEDYWATPREFFAHGGDCEDYAIAKYLSLRALGWPAERLRVAVVHDNARDLVHAALIAYHGGNAYLLDIEIAEVTDHRNVARYTPIFAISENGWWSYRAPPAVEIVKAVAKIEAAKPVWRSLHVRHRPARAAPPPRLTAPVVVHHAKSAGWRSQHLKHPPRLAKAKLHPAPHEPAVVGEVAPATTRETRAAQETPEPAIVAEPGERIEELFLPGAK